MEGFTVNNSNRFLETGSFKDSSSIGISGIKQPTVGSTSEGSQSFADTLKDAIGQVNQLQKTADKASQDLATGRTDNVADVMIAADKADIALRMMVQVRNKVIDAYNEILKMQV